VNRTRSEIHCEVCGKSASAASVQYCLECGLYVGPTCWDGRRGRCVACLESADGRRRPGSSLRTARRADRRLREVIAEASTIAQLGGPGEGGDAQAEVACLLIKWSTAERLGVQALARLQGTRAAEVRALTDRVERHTVQARSALERADDAAASLTASDADPGMPTVDVAPDEPGARQATRAQIRWAIPLVAATLAAVVVIPVWLSRFERGDPPREGTLAGDGPAATSLITPSPMSGQAGMATEEDVLTFNFDEERMDLGIGAAWRSIGGADAVALAAFPTAVNRSARLQNANGSGAEACQSVPASRGRLTRLVADVVVSEAPATASIIARWAGGGEVRANLGTSESSMVIGGATVVAHEPGVAIAQWYQVAIAFDEARTRWRVEGGAGSAPLIERSIDINALQTVDEVCVAISDDSTGQVHFDNITIAIRQEG
jgi:hypothetical protein